MPILQAMLAALGGGANLPPSPRFGRRISTKEERGRQQVATLPVARRHRLEMGEWRVGRGGDIEETKGRRERKQIPAQARAAKCRPRSNIAPPSAQNGPNRLGNARAVGFLTAAVARRQVSNVKPNSAASRCFALALAVLAAPKRWHAGSIRQRLHHLFCRVAAGASKSSSQTKEMITTLPKSALPCGASSCPFPLAPLLECSF